MRDRGTDLRLEVAWAREVAGEMCDGNGVFIWRRPRVGLRVIYGRVTSLPPAAALPTGVAPAPDGLDTLRAQRAGSTNHKYRSQRRDEGCRARSSTAPIVQPLPPTTPQPLRLPAQNSTQRTIYTQLTPRSTASAPTVRATGSAARPPAMSQFFENLWSSIFTPGPTPTLLVATNASFAALQAVLFALLLATYSIHFVVLSFLCGGLWWAINWFANELREAQEKEDAAKKIRERRDREREKSREADDLASAREPAVGREGGEGEGMDTGDDTETETETEVDLKKKAPAAAPLSGVAAGLTTGAQSALASTADDALKKRRSVGEGAESSTDSEWEKIEQER